MVWSELLVWSRCTHDLGNFLRKFQVDLCETVTGHAFVDDGIITVVQFKAEGLPHMQLLWWGQGIEKELGLIVMFFELVAQSTLLDASYRLWVSLERSLIGFGGRHGIEAVGPVVDSTLRDAVAHLSISIVVQHWADWTVDR